MSGDLLEPVEWRFDEPQGGIVIDLPQWRGADWGSILVRARSSEGIGSFFVGFNTAPGAARRTTPAC